jgi:hypothetical protein
MFIYLMNFRRSVFVAVSVIDSRLLARAGLISGKGKGKGHPITGYEGPRGGVEV